MISAVAFCPHPPLLIPEIAAGAASELASLREHALNAVRDLAAAGEQIVAIGASSTSQLHSPLARGTFAGFGVPLELALGSSACGGSVELPMSLTVGAWLVHHAIGSDSGVRGASIGPDFGSSRTAAELLRICTEESVALLVLADGSARRSRTAPGYLDERAAAFDAGIEAALRDGDADSLAELDLEVARELLADGAPALRAAGRLLDGQSWAAELLASADPYGVAYWVAAWVASRRQP